MALILPARRGIATYLPTPLTSSFTASYSTGANSSTYTDSVADIGAEPTGGQRRFVFTCTYTSGDLNDGQLPDSVTFGGVAGTVVKHENCAVSNGCGCGIWYREMPTGTSTTIVFNGAITASRGGLYTGVVYSDEEGIDIRATYGDQNGTLSISGIEVKRDDVIIVSGGSYGDGTISMTGDVTADYDDNMESANAAIGGFQDVSADGSYTVTVVESGTEQALAVAVIKPAATA